MPPIPKPVRRPAIPDLAEAEAIAAGALAFIAEDGARLGAFMQATGVDPATLARDARGREMLEAVLAFLVEDDSAVMMFAVGAGIPPERVAIALAVLQRSAR